MFSGSWDIAKTKLDIFPLPTPFMFVYRGRAWRHLSNFDNQVRNFRGGSPGPMGRKVGGRVALRQSLWPKLYLLPFLKLVPISKPLRIAPTFWIRPQNITRPAAHAQKKKGWKIGLSPLIICTPRLQYHFHICFKSIWKWQHANPLFVW